MTSAVRGRSSRRIAGAGPAHPFAGERCQGRHGHVDRCDSGWRGEPRVAQPFAVHCLSCGGSVAAFPRRQGGRRCSADHVQILRAWRPPNVLCWG